MFISAWEEQGMSNVSAEKAVSLSWKKTIGRLKGNYTDWLAGMLALIAIRLAALTPLLTLVFCQEGSSLRYLALLTPVLYFFIVLPLRYSMGEAMHYALKGEHFATPRLVLFDGYGEKLGAILKQALHLLPWALPLLAGLCAGWYLMYFVEDGTVVLRMVISLGKVFGEDYGFMEGVYLIVAFFGLLLLVLLYGMVRNGMLRFLWKEAGGKYALARKEMLRRLKGLRGGQVCVAAIQVLLLLPVLLPSGYMGYRLLRDFVKDMSLDLSQLAEPQMLWGLIAVLFLLYLPLLPLRKVLQAYFIKLPEDDK
jgi:hypothetical protein